MPSLNVILRLIGAALFVIVTVGPAFAVEYDVTIKTGSIVNAGTDANVWILLHGERGNSARTELDSEYNDFEAKSERIYRIATRELGDITKITVGHDNAGSRPGWFLEYVKLRRLDDNKIHIFPVNRWFSILDGDLKTERDILSTSMICKIYADTAIQQLNAMRQTPNCNFRADPNRWNPSRQIHYNWCSGVLNRDMFSKVIPDEIGGRASELRRNCNIHELPGIHPISISVDTILSVVDTDEFDSDEPYIIAVAVNLVPLLPGITRPLVEVTLYGPWDDLDEKEQGTRPALRSWKPFWSTNNDLEILHPENAILIIAVMENDDGDTDGMRSLVKATVIGSAMAFDGNRDVMVTKLLRDIDGTLDIPLGLPEADDRIGRPQELRVSYGDMAELLWSDYVGKRMKFRGDGGSFVVWVSVTRR